MNCPSCTHPMELIVDLARRPDFWYCSQETRYWDCRTVSEGLNVFRPINDATRDEQAPRVLVGIGS